MNTATDRPWCVQTRHRDLCPEWTTKFAGICFERAKACARDYRSDGYEARIRVWCSECDMYKTSYLGDRCAQCQSLEPLAKGNVEP